MTITADSTHRQPDGMFLDCPAYLDARGAVKCGLPAEVRCRFTMGSSDGSLESAMIRCPVGHWYSGPVESLTGASTQQHHRGTARAGSRASRNSPRGGHEGRDGRDEPAAPASPAQPQRDLRCPSGAPAYYLGRPARVWVTAMTPRCPAKRTAAAQLMPAPIGA